MCFFSYEESEEIYKNSLEKCPLIFNKLKIRRKEWIEKAKPYKIIINAKYDDLKFYIDSQNSTINRILAENIMNKINGESIEKNNYVEIERTIDPKKIKNRRIEINTKKSLSKDRLFYNVLLTNARQC